MKKVLAFDIGGTNTRLALINENYEIEKIVINPTIKNDNEAFRESLSLLLKNFDYNGVSACGMGLPGVLNMDRSTIVKLPNVGVKDVEIKDWFKKDFGLDVYARNDAELACLGEATLGAGKSYSRVFFITISTGLGGALCVDRVNQDYIVEIGHTPYEYQGQMLEYELLASGSGLPRLAKINGLKIESAKELFSGVRAQDELSLKVYDEWLKILTDFVNMIQKDYHPEIICFTGGVMKEKEMFFAELKARNPGSHLVECALGDKAGLLGSAAYAFAHLSKSGD